MTRRVIGIAMLGGFLVCGFSPDADADKKKKKKPKPEEKEQAPEPPPPEPDPVPPPPPPEPEKPTPWGEGVPQEKKDAAQALLEQGNNLFLEKKYDEALGVWTQAVAEWEHPSIRFNMVRALIQLQKPVEALASLELALKYGAEPHEEAIYNEALAYEKLLRGQIAEIEITCKQPDVKVTLDGQPFLDCPGTQRTRLVPGPHSVIGRKKGHLTFTQDVSLFGGSEEAIPVELVPLEKAGVATRKWDAWKPWAVVGGGALIGGVGALVQLDATSKMNQYNDAVGESCAEGGCTPPMDECPADETCLENHVANLEKSALLRNKIAIGLMATGGAVVVTGIVLVIMNREKIVYPTETSEPSGVAITPLPEGGAAVSFGGSF